jgi:hypothetical protein
MKASAHWGATSIAVALYSVVCGQCRSETDDHKRVLLLERKVARLEALLTSLSAGKRAGGRVKVGKTAKAAIETAEDTKEPSPQAASTTTTNRPAPSASPAPAQKVARSDANAGRSEANATQSDPKAAHSDANDAHADANAVGVGQPNDAPQELFVLRENNVTLKPTAWEAYTDVSYVSRIGLLQTDHAVLGSTSLRYGVLDWLELSATVPYGYASRTSQTGPGTAAKYSFGALGDSTIQANARLLQQSQNWPGVVLSLGVIIPTGPNPYTFANYALDSPHGIATPNPTNVLRDYFSVGAWGVHSNLQFFKTMDPVILFFGGGVDYLFDQTVDGYYPQQGMRYNYNAGFSFALSDKTTLGFSINGTYENNLLVNGRTVPASSLEPSLARLSIIQRMNKNLFLEPSVAFGLNSYSPNTQFDLGLRARF